MPSYLVLALEETEDGPRPRERNGIFSAENDQDAQKQWKSWRPEPTESFRHCVYRIEDTPQGKLNLHLIGGD